MDKRFSRTALLLGKEGMKRLSEAKVAVFGLGGVGSYVVEALARSGVGSLDLIDNDTISETNINRQLIALSSTVGKYKADVAMERVLDINPSAKVCAYKVFFTSETANMFDFSSYDYIVDAIDTVSAKLELAVRAQSCSTPIISSMGTGNKLSPADFKVADITETSVCPLARVMRRELKRRGVQHLKVVYSQEYPLVPLGPDESGTEPEPLPEGRRSIPGSVAFVPSSAGLLIASEVICAIAGVST